MPSAQVLYPESQMGDMRFEMRLMDLGFCPLERLGVLDIGGDEFIDGPSKCQIKVMLVHLTAR